MKQFNWRKMDPSDGYFALVKLAGEVHAKLVFGLYVGGKLHHCMTIQQCQYPTSMEVGQLKRQLIVWEAIAEYLNAGGMLDDMRDVFNPMLVEQLQAALVFPCWTYFDTGISTEGNRVHEFINDDGDRFIRWVRNEFIDVDLTLEQMGGSDNNDRDRNIGVSADTEDLREIGDEAAGQDDQGVDGVFGT